MKRSGPSGNLLPSILETFDQAKLEALMRRFGELKAAVLGDFFLDKYLDVEPRLAEVSLETGRTAHQVVAVRHSPGAAGTVAANLATLMELDRPGRRGPGGSILAIGFSGDDGEGWELRRDLEAIGVDTSRLATDRGAGRRTPVYLKPRCADRPGLDGEHDRYDLKNRVPTGAGIESAAAASARDLFDSLDLFIVMDQVEDDGFGAVTPGLRLLLGSLVSARKGPKPLAWADSRRRIRAFSGFMCKMNEFELMGVSDPEPGAAVADGEILRALPGAEAAVGAPVFVTAGSRGVWGNGPGGPFLVPAVNIEGPVDPTGAGDSFTAGAALALASGACREEAALVGCLVASVTVRKLGMTGTATPGELKKALDIWKEQRS